ncbi:MAG TPA: efflux RND transporter periplasmic adaptor subunit [Burkholderiaceae bacterium]|jgi:RND family efflux transporter MFP subunit|nr:efflux RND transporter periplasmic adaptor subunit [Burkholderiaceae bacterium]
MSEQRHAALGIHGTDPDPTHDSSAMHLPKRGPVLKRAKMISASILVLLALGAVGNVVLRAGQARALAESTAEGGRMYVTTINASTTANDQPLTLPGTLQGIIESPIYARSSGYVLRWNKDIGAHVAKGEVLAVIDTPEVDQQLSQAKAAREQAASSLDLAKTSAERWVALRKKDAVTQQELNERTSAYTQAEASLAAADANVKRLQQLEGFKQVVAPFAGVVTRRNVDVGDLIDAGNGGAGRALFTLAQVDPLRVYVYVPQTYAQRIKAGDPVSVTQNELAGQVFKGTVARTAGAIDAATRTMQIEVNLPNRDGKLLAGAYVQVALPVSGTSNALTVPSNVLLFRPEGTRIAVVDASGHVKLHTVTIGHDLGNSLEILTGITAADKLVLNPADSLTDNDVVIPTPAKAPDTAKKAAL